MAFFSKKSDDYINPILNLEKPKYASTYNNTISDIMDKIANREEFNYDFNADPLYQNYKDQYTKLGNEAAMNAAAAVSNMTGGFGNSYAATAASQANQQYLTQLNDKIPELYNAAMNKYQMEIENLYNQFGMYETEENRLYGQHRDNVADYYADYGNLVNGFSIAQAQENADRQFEYQLARDEIEDDRWERSFDYNAGRDAVSDSQWQKQFDTANSQWQQQFDESKRQWQTEYDLALQKAMQKGSGGGGKSSDGSKTSKIDDNGKVNNSEKRSVTFSGKARENNVINNGKSLGSEEEKIAYLNQLASSDSSFTKGDWYYFAEKIGL